MCELVSSSSGFLRDRARAPLLPHVFPFIPLQARRSSVEEERSKDFYNLRVPNVAFKASMRTRRHFQTFVVELNCLNLRRKHEAKLFLDFSPKGRLVAAHNKIAITAVLYKALKF